MKKLVLIIVVFFSASLAYSAEVLSCKDSRIINAAAKQIDTKFYKHYVIEKGNAYDSHVVSVTEDAYSQKRGIRLCHADVKLTRPDDTEFFTESYGAKFSVDDKLAVKVIKLYHPPKDES